MLFDLDENRIELIPETKEVDLFGFYKFHPKTGYFYYDGTATYIAEHLADLPDHSDPDNLLQFTMHAGRIADPDLYDWLYKLYHAHIIYYHKADGYYYAKTAH